MNLKIGSHSFHLSLTVLALVAGGLFVYARLGNGASVGNWLALAHQEARTAAAAKVRAAALNTQASHARASAQFFQDSMGTLEGVFDSLVAAAQKPVTGVTVAQIGAACRATVSACQARGDSLATADSLDRLRADTAERRAVIADSIIHVGVKAASCKFLVLFPCPSREQAFFVGAAVTAIGAILTHH